MLGMGEDKQDVFVDDLESLEGDIEDYTKKKKPNTITLVNPTYYLSLLFTCSSTFSNPFLLTFS